MGDINNIMREMSRMEDNPHVATHTMVFMVRPYKSSRCYPVAHYATKPMSGSDIYTVFWEIIYALDRYNIHVRTSVVDGASANRRLIAIHKADFPYNVVTHSTLANLYILCRTYPIY